MILPVYIQGHSVLHRPSVDIDPSYDGLQQLVSDMWETMYHAEGIGLAAPQVGRNIRLFVIDASSWAKDDPACAGFKRVFINPRVIDYSEEQASMNEGCLSIPGIHEAIIRPAAIVIAYKDEQWTDHLEHFDGLRARVVQHEYDHVEGITFIDHLSALRKRLVKSKLAALAAGKFPKDYRVVLPGK